MSVAFARAVIDGCREYGVTMHESPGCMTRGNGLASAYEGGLFHHTGGGFVHEPRILWDGRSDLSPPLANSSGNPDGSITIVAAHPANHAGASGGRSMGPLPVTRLFNPRVWGHEISYPGDVPPTPEQYRSACVLGRVLSRILGRPSAEWMRLHAETSVTGKWDAGFAPGRTIDAAEFRRDVWNVSPGGLTVADAASLERQLNEIITELRGPERKGWPTVRHGIAAAQQPRATLVDLVLGLDRELNSRLTRDVPGAASDTVFGQLLSTRAELRRLADSGGIDAEAVTRGIVAELVPAVRAELGEAAPVDAAQIEAACDRAVRRVLSSIAPAA